MKAVAILIHGFNVWDGGRATVGILRPFFALVGMPYVMVTYGWLGLLGTRLKNRRIARSVAQACKAVKVGGHRVVVVGHSNGCAICHLAAKDYGAVIDVAVYVNPALEEDIDPPSNIGALHVWHSPSDGPVKWARWLLPSSARPWGRMGAIGYTGKSRRVRNFNKESNFPVVSEEHSDLFDVERVPFFGSVVAQMAADELQAMGG